MQLEFGEIAAAVVVVVAAAVAGIIRTRTLHDQYKLAALQIWMIVVE